MALHDTAIVGYAETKIVERSERDVWELGAEILEALLAARFFEAARQRRVKMIGNQGAVGAVGPTGAPASKPKKQKGLGS